MATKRITLGKVSISVLLDSSGKANGTYGKNVSFSFGNLIPEGATISKKEITFTAGTPVGVSTLYVNGTSVPKKQTSTIEIDSDAETAKFEWKVSFTRPPTSTYNYITVEFSDVAVVATYNEEAGISPPSNVTLSASSCYVGNTVQLAWSGASGDIVGYDIEKRDSSDGGMTYGSWLKIQTVDTTSTGSSVDVSPNDTVGAVRQFRVRSVSSSASSDYATATQSLKTIEQYEQQPLSIMPPYFAVHIWRRVR